VTVLVGVGEWYNVAVTVVLQAVCKLGFEDIISKRATSVYRFSANQDMGQSQKPELARSNACS
jgi:hypothetical protein